MNEKTARISSSFLLKRPVLKQVIVVPINALSVTNVHVNQQVGISGPAPPRDLMSSPQGGNVHMTLTTDNAH